jgi:hypothetical protein
MTMARKPKEGEPSFTILATDVIAPVVVRCWADMAESKGAPAEKVADARKIAADMEAYAEKHGAKVPD